MLKQRTKELQQNQPKESKREHQIKKINQYMFDLYDQIGRGYSSVVFQAYDTLSGKKLAVKAIQLKKITNQIEKKLLNNQVKALKSLQHPNILKAIDVLQTSNNFYVITEFYESSLENVLKSSKFFSDNEAIEFVEKMAEILCYLQEKAIVHRDIKPSNIFVKGKQYVLGDFGFCGFLRDKKNSMNNVHYNVGSPLYMSPEAKRDSLYSVKSDIWSLGICLLEIVMRKKPFPQLDYDQMINKITENNFINGLQTSEIIKKILKKTLEPSIQLRAYPSQILRILAGTSQKCMLGLESNKVLAENITKFMQTQKKNDKLIQFKGKHNRKYSNHDPYSFGVFSHRRNYSEKQNTETSQPLQSPRSNEYPKKISLSQQKYNTKAIAHSNSNQQLHHRKFSNSKHSIHSPLSNQLTKRSPYLDKIYHPLSPMLYCLVADAQIKQNMIKMKLAKLLMLICPPIPRPPPICHEILHFRMQYDSYYEYVLGEIGSIIWTQIDHYLLYYVKACFKCYALEYQQGKKNKQETEYNLKIFHEFYYDYQKKKELIKANQTKYMKHQEYLAQKNQSLTFEQLLTCALNVMKN